MKNNLRLYLWGALALVLFYDYQLWMRDYAPSPTLASATAEHAAPATPASDLGNRIPQAAPAGTAASGPAEGSASAPPATTASDSAAGTTAAPQDNAAPPVHVRTDVLDVQISPLGGTLEQVDLPAYPKVKGEAAPVRLENHDDPQALYELQSGLTGPAGAEYPTHLATYTSERSDYALAGGNELKVPLTWRADGVTVTKTFVFRRGQYQIGLDYDVRNDGSAPWSARPYLQILRNDPPTKRSYFNVESYAFHGPALWDGTKYRKLDSANADDSRLSLDVRDGWLAAVQHHFLSAVVPPRGAPWHFGLGVQGPQYLLSATGPEQTVAPGGHAQFHTTLFVGPKLQAQLDATAPELGHVADYGHLWFLARPLFLALSWVHGLTGNWGVAIILVTLLLKLVFYPLSEASGRSMAKMKTLQPRIKNLQETYADDREKLGRAMMELYKREKINPLASCLPVVIQIPVFIAFYWVLLESVEMRQAPFAFWIHDLSARDPLFILPIIMAGAMFVQYKLNPAPPDPVQAKVFMIMPLVMSATFAFFPAGLVLYWVTNTVLSIAQQWNINRRLGTAGPKKS
ncbi:MAG TPA: membrane protein insertase YidC [Steroidobacteraceae bacterium]|jgi:YidC/Oxa1 family membrane protein insertase|nr:membrane protein insertase YidC [Steroidobacteraceae bacterium]